MAERDVIQGRAFANLFVAAIIALAVAATVNDQAGFPGPDDAFFELFNEFLSLRLDGKMPAKEVAAAITTLGIDPDKRDPMSV